MFLHVLQGGSLKVSHCQIIGRPKSYYFVVKPANAIRFFSLNVDVTQALIKYSICGLICDVSYCT